jgi:hypothetical protein
MSMNRREMLKAVSLGAALPVLPAQGHQGHSHGHQHGAPGQQPKGELKFFSPEQAEYVAQLAETIIPQTDTPGARAVGVHLYIDKMLSAADPPEQARFLEGLKWLDERAGKVHGAPFAKLTGEQQYALLAPLAGGNHSPEDQPGVRFFAIAKALTIDGYYTSADGFVSELGFSNGFTGDFPGCTHPEHE